MHRTTNTTPLVFLCGSLLGLAVGATIGVLYAPAKGARTRRQLARKAEELGERATGVAESALEALERGRLIA
ncbi:MAG TPA: YtxH domain-containing protein [Thermoanaerobaculia bacterium]|nr:YtxH domain-containing protein [Thermoanaerobaculia bacterium]